VQDEEGGRDGLGGSHHVFDTDSVHWKRSLELRYDLVDGLVLLGIGSMEDVLDALLEGSQS
jgi:hypothetical protein